LWCSQSGNHPENNLAKVGYIQDTKMGKKKRSFYILGYLLDLMAIQIAFSLESDEFGSFFH
jgi:hypothetical protein